jgi:hypothetical protein
MDAWREEIKAWRKEMTACREATETCLEKVKANPEKKKKTGLEEMEAVVDVFKERLDKMDTMDLETNPEEIKARVEILGSP